MKDRAATKSNQIAGSSQSTLKGCVNECLQRASNEPQCKSVMKDTRSAIKDTTACKLYGALANSQTAEGGSSLYFERPSWYLGLFSIVIVKVFIGIS